MRYFEFLYGSGIICFLWIFQKNCIDNISSKRQKRQRLIAFNTMQYPRTLQNNIYHSKKRVPPPFFHSDTNWPRSDPFFWQNPCSGCNSWIDLVVALEYIFFQLCSNAEQISVRLAKFRRSYAKHAAVVLTSHTSYFAFLLDVRCAVQSEHVPFFAAVCPRW